MTQFKYLCNNTVKSHPILEVPIQVFMLSFCTEKTEGGKGSLPHSLICSESDCFRAACKILNPKKKPFRDKSKLSIDKCKEKTKKHNPVNNNNISSQFSLQGP